MAYSAIQGALPFSGGGKDYASAYNAALTMNSKNYSNILAGYQQTMASQQEQQAKIAQGYGDLTNQVLGGIQGMDAAQRQAIQDQFMVQKGLSQQQLTNRGLANSTIQQSVDRGLTYDAAKANVMLTGQTQGINAQYLSQLGSQALGYRAHALDQSTGLAKNQLDWMNSVNAAYPNAAAYSQLAQMKGMSGMGGGVGGGATTFGGAVKSPLSGGAPSQSPAINGWEYGSGQFGYNAPRRNYGDSPSEIYPGGDWWDSGTGMGTGRFAENSSGLFDSQQGYEGSYGGGNAGGGNWDQMQDSIWGGGNIDDQGNDQSDYVYSDY